MFRSNRLSDYGVYSFASLSALRREVEQKQQVIDMGVGDPDMPPPKEIQGALVASLADGKNHQYPDYQGDDFFRNAVAKFFLNRYKVKLDPDRNILALVGSKEGIFHLPLAVLNPGEIGAYTDPGYPVYRAGISFAGAVPRNLPLREQNGFLPQLDEIPAGTKLLWINYPNNPTTAIADAKFLKKIVETAHNRGFLIANDAAYSETYFNQPPQSILSVPDAIDVAIEFHSLSKTFCMTGWRIGFVVGNESAISSLATLKRYVDSGSFRAVQYAAKTALDNYWTLCEPIRKIYARRVANWIEALQYVGIEGFNFGATFYVWAKVPEKFPNDSEFAQELLRKTGIIAMPGSAMGSAGSGFIRFAMTLPDDDIHLAKEKLQKFEL